MNFIKNSIQKTRQFAIAHKVISTVIIIAIGFGSYQAVKIFRGGAQTQYVLGTVEKGTLISSVTGSGQVSASNEVDLKSKVSGDVTFVGAVNGQEVKAGTLIAKIDARDAWLSLEKAKIALAKLENSSPVSLSGAQNSVSSARDSFDQAYNSAFNSIVGSYNDMASIITALNNMFYTKDSSPYFSNDSLSLTYGALAEQYKMSAGVLLDRVTQEYKNFRPTYVATSRQATSTIEKTLTQEHAIAQDLLQVIKNTSATVNYIITQTDKQSRTAAMTADQNNLTTWAETMNQDTTNLLNGSGDIENGQRTLDQNIASLEALKFGSNPLDIQSAQVALEQAQNTYDQYFIRAPFDGMVARLDVKENDSISGGASIGTFITQQKNANVSLSEVDVAQVKVGQKATLTFDAINGLSIAGEVLELDLVGTITQGVVTYNVKIGFDAQDERVKSGMSVSAAIITDVKQDVLIVPNSAVKTGGNNHYVEVFYTKFPLATRNRSVTSPTPPRQQSVEAGVSNDTSTEIVSGLKDGDVIVIRTIAASAVKTATAPSIFGTSGNRNSAGGARVPAR